MAAINAAAQNRITGILKKIPLRPRERVILLSIDRYLLSIDQYTAAVYLMRSMTFLPHPGQGQPLTPVGCLDKPAAAAGLCYPLPPTGPLSETMCAASNNSGSGRHDMAHRPLQAVMTASRNNA